MKVFGVLYTVQLNSIYLSCSVIFTGNIACNGNSVTRGDFAVFRRAGATHCVNWGEIRVEESTLTTLASAFPEIGLVTP